MFITKPDATVQAICKAAFPEYNGRTIQIGSERLGSQQRTEDHA